MESESVWRALSSSHRRRLLELMRDGPKSTGQLAAAMPGLTRFAVMQHLGVLVEAGLVLVRREGRTRLNYSNPASLRHLLEPWLSPVATRAAEAAQHLRRYVEQHEAQQTMSESQQRLVKIELETMINAPKDVVFRAMTAEYGAWWPHRVKAGATIYFEPRVGGMMGETWPEGGGIAYGTVTMIDPGRAFSSVGIGMFGDYTATNTESVEAVDGGTLYKKKLHLWGDISSEIEKMMREGAQALTQKSLKEYCEAQAQERR